MRMYMKFYGRIVPLDKFLIEIFYGFFRNEQYFFKFSKIWPKVGWAQNKNKSSMVGKSCF